MKITANKPKKPRTDKRKNVWKVAEVLIKNPNSTEREIAKEAWVSNWTAHNAKIELEQTWAKDETIAYIVGSSKNRLKRIQMVLDRFIDETESKEELSRWDTALIKEIAKDDMARITVLWGNITDDNGWFDVKTLTNEELLQLAIGKF